MQLVRQLLHFKTGMVLKAKPISTDQADLSTDASVLTSGGTSEEMLKQDRSTSSTQAKLTDRITLQPTK